MRKINWAREMRILGDIDPTPEYKDVIIPKLFSGIWCQNVKNHPIVRHPITHELMRMRPVECEKRENGTYFCPTCKEVMERIDPPHIGSWVSCSTTVETRAGYPKSMTRIL